MTLEFPGQIFRKKKKKFLKYQISLKSIQWEPSCSLRTDRHDGAHIRSTQFCEHAKNWTKMSAQLETFPKKYSCIFAHYMGFCFCAFRHDIYNKVCCIYLHTRYLRRTNSTAQEDGKVVSLTNRSHLPPGNPPGTHFFYRLSRPQGHSAIGRIMSVKNSNDTIGNRTSDLQICSTAP